MPFMLLAPKLQMITRCNSERDFCQKFIEEDATFTLSFNFLLSESRRLPAFGTFLNLDHFLSQNMQNCPFLWFWF